MIQPNQKNKLIISTPIYKSLLMAVSLGFCILASLKILAVYQPLIGTPLFLLILLSLALTFHQERDSASFNAYCEKYLFFLVLHFMGVHLIYIFALSAVWYFLFLLVSLCAYIHLSSIVYARTLSPLKTKKLSVKDFLQKGLSFGKVIFSLIFFLVFFWFFSNVFLPFLPIEVGLLLIYVIFVSVFFLVPQNIHEGLNRVKKNYKMRKKHLFFFGQSFARHLFFIKKFPEAIWDIQIIWLISLKLMQASGFVIPLFCIWSFKQDGCLSLSLFMCVGFLTSYYVSLPSSQVYFFKKYSKKSLRLVGWNVFSKVSMECGLQAAKIIVVGGIAYVTTNVIRDTGTVRRYILQLDVHAQREAHVSNMNLKYPEAAHKFQHTNVPEVPKFESHSFKTSKPLITFAPQLTCDLKKPGTFDSGGSGKI